MRAAEHRAEAERLLARAQDSGDRDVITSKRTSDILAAAQVHATLAQLPDAEASSDVDVVQPLDEAALRTDERNRIANMLESVRVDSGYSDRRRPSNFGTAADYVRRFTDDLHVNASGYITRETP